MKSELSWQYEEQVQRPWSWNLLGCPRNSEEVGVAGGARGESGRWQETGSRDRQAPVGHHGCGLDLKEAGEPLEDIEQGWHE